MEKRQASSFYPYFSIEERPTVDKLVGLFNEVKFKDQPILTDFLDPGQRDILTKIVGNAALISENGGYQAAEKRRVYLDPSFAGILPMEFQVLPFEICYPEKFNELNHSAILGTLANLGISLETIGDIITDGNGHWQFFAKKELADFFLQEVDRIGRVKVRLKRLKNSQVLTPIDDGIKSEVFSVSLRLDALIAKITNNSRSQVKTLIEAGLVKLNWHQVENSNIMIKDNDVLSIRHFGRIKILKFSTTKKARFKVVYKLWQKNTKKIR